MQCVSIRIVPCWYTPHLERAEVDRGEAALGDGPEEERADLTITSSGVILHRARSKHRNVGRKSTRGKLVLQTQPNRRREVTAHCWTRGGRASCAAPTRRRRRRRSAGLASRRRRRPTCRRKGSEPPAHGAEGGGGGGGFRAPRATVPVSCWKRGTISTYCDVFKRGDLQLLRRVQERRSSITATCSTEAILTRRAPSTRL